MDALASRMVSLSSFPMVSIFRVKRPEDFSQSVRRQHGIGVHFHPIAALSRCLCSPNYIPYILYIGIGPTNFCAVPHRNWRIGRETRASAV
jgi:hypothetical protein